MRRHQQSRHVLGSDALLTIVLDDSQRPKPVFNQLWQRIEEFEQRFSRFLPNSELSRFNTAAGIEQPVSPEFRALLASAKNYAEKTAGLYNPFILPALQRAGYKGSWPTPQQANPKLGYEDRVVAGWHGIIIDDDWSQIPSNTAIDFGGIGKGYLLDQLGETLREQGVNNYWLSLGGDILCSGTNASGDSWYIGIAHATDKTKTVAAVKNRRRKLAIATSGTTKRRGVGEAGEWHHIIDPRTGKPADTPVLTATACADNAATADVAATCLVIDPETPQLNVAGYILQTTDGRTVSVQKTGDAWE